MVVYVYIDGFNLYYGALRDTPHRWLNLYEFCRNLLPKTSEIRQIKYFTARVKARSKDLQQPARQEVYLRALKTVPLISTHFGEFLCHEVWMPTPEGQSVRVFTKSVEGFLAVPNSQKS